MKIIHKEIIKDFYAGIGSRETLQNILDNMFNLGYSLAKRNYCLRSGGAIGVDSSFEKGCDYINGSKEIYYVNDSNDSLIEFVKQYHPTFDKLKEYHKKLHARNVLQIFGHDLEVKSNFVVCWTPDGYGTDKSIKRSKKTGGTGTAIQIALDYDIPVFNLKCMEIRDVINEIKGIR